MRPSLAFGLLVVALATATASANHATNFPSAAARDDTHIVIDTPGQYHTWIDKCTRVPESTFYFVNVLARPYGAPVSQRHPVGTMTPRWYTDSNGQQRPIAQMQYFFDDVTPCTTPGYYWTNVTVRRDYAGYDDVHHAPGWYVYGYQFFVGHSMQQPGEPPNPCVAGTDACYRDVGLLEVRATANDPIGTPPGPFPPIVTTTRTGTQTTTTGTATSTTTTTTTGAPSIGPTTTTSAPTGTTAAFTVNVRGLSVELDATSSRAADGGSLRYDWTLGGIDVATGAKATHTYAAAGTYTIGLTVTDLAGSQARATRTVQVVPEKPDGPTARLTVDNVSPKAGVKVNFTSASTAPAGSSIKVYEWDMGDGIFGTAGAKVQWRFREEGPLTIRLKVTDDRGRTDTASLPINVLPAPPSPTTTTTTTPRQTTTATTTTDAGIPGFLMPAAAVALIGFAVLRRRLD